MQHKVRYAVRAARALATPTEAEDEVFLMTFPDRPEMRVPLNRDYGSIADGLTGVQANGSTALVDATYRALQEIRASSHGREALAVISDGGDRASRYSEAEIKRRAIESDAQIYSISIVEGTANREGWRAR